MVPFKLRGDSHPTTWALVSPESMSPTSVRSAAVSAQAKHGGELIRLQCRLAAGPNPWADSGAALIIDNARAKVAGERQRVRIRLAA